eukprot:TRINITY_DN3337_c0_g1_i1.p1 TRINITY_DN3337_c0_g1~~TRINITY_DN3337_c0_g1_i1.p1  ORF type:complete len:334 (-),score=79.42 TRINITY_DN3337_c0_g1_i1:74-1075(-)
MFLELQSIPLDFFTPHRHLEQLIAVCPDASFSWAHLASLSTTVLRVLDLTSARISDRGVEPAELLSRLPLLETVDVSHTKLSDSFLMALFQHCLLLSAVNVCGCKVTNGAFQPDRIPSSLRFLNMSETRANGLAVANVIAQCPNLTYLDISFCEMMTVELLESIPTHCGRLRTLRAEHLQMVPPIGPTAHERYRLVGRQRIQMIDAAAPLIEAALPRLCASNIEIVKVTTDWEPDDRLDSEMLDMAVAEANAMHAPLLHLHVYEQRNLDKDDLAYRSFHYTDGAGFGLEEYECGDSCASDEPLEFDENASAESAAIEQDEMDAIGVTRTMLLL